MCVIALRDYQQAAVVAAVERLAEPGSGTLLSLPCGSGKSVIASAVIDALWQAYGKDWRVLVAVHVQELVEQDHEKGELILGADNCGICSAGLGRFELDRPATFASIQTLAVPTRLPTLPRIDLLMIDEVHCVAQPPETVGQNSTALGQYARIIRWLRSLNPDLRILGLTGTPWRLGEKAVLYRSETNPKSVFADICYQLPMGDPDRARPPGAAADAAD